MVIYSGQLISLTSGAWVLGCTAGKTPYLAFHDSVDPDVLSAGTLLGISLSGNFVFETPWFTLAAGAFNANDLPLKADTGATVLTPGSFSGAGCITLASAFNDTADIIGVTSNGGQQNVTAINSEGTAAGSPPVVNTIIFDALCSPKRT